MTADLSGRRVHEFVVSGQWMVYCWTPASTSGSPNHLVARNLSTNAETEIENPWPGGGLAMDGSRAVYVMRATGKNAGPDTVVLCDVSDGSRRDVAQAQRIRELDISGNRLVWVQDIERGSAVAVMDLNGTTPQLLDPVTGYYAHEPRIDGDHVVWARGKPNQGFSLFAHNIATGVTHSLNVENAGRDAADVSDGFVVYFAKDNDIWTLYAHKLDTGESRAIAQVERYIDGPSVREGLVAWIDHVPKEEFKPLAGHPLLDERDFRNLYCYDAGRGKARLLAANIFALSRPYVGDDGHVYATAQRQLHTAHDTNVTTPLDVRRW